MSSLSTSDCLVLAYNILTALKRLANGYFCRGLFSLTISGAKCSHLISCALSAR